MKPFLAMSFVAVAALAVAGVLVYRMGPPSAGNTVAPAPAADADHGTLMGRAKALAETELSRLNAAEMIYRNQVYVHMYTMTNSPATPSRMCMKLYRQFTRFEIADIEQTDSLLRPIKFTIRYSFDLVGTRGEGVINVDPGVLRRAHDDHAFIVHRSDSILREYLCDAKGQAAGSPALPERPNYFLNSSAQLKFGEFALEGPMARPEGG